MPDKSPERTLEEIVAAARACRACEEHLPLGPRPVVRAAPSARLLIVGQAPGTRVHETGIPWNDRSGERLRDWLRIPEEVFYDETRVAIVPMGFCYPGVDAKGGDKPPRPECAPLWHEPLRAGLRKVELTLLVGMYAQKHYLGKRRQKTLTETVRHWRDALPDFLPLPHPSWRNTVWLKKNPWFEEDLLPELRKRVKRLVA
ncbi:uracil-DNA glycosylase family protein [Pelagibius sp. CAU 1746]|uniref:uracil-DNA glycosylase family protein n=1 Tax=Pelagibius sp. CAU 1746 TaxID=3140370 RepID=UPI00325BFB62